jgi:hypothetical protein
MDVCERGRQNKKKKIILNGSIINGSKALRVKEKTMFTFLLKYCNILSENHMNLT